MSKVALVEYFEAKDRVVKMLDQDDLTAAGRALAAVTEAWGLLDKEEQREILALGQVRVDSWAGEDSQSFLEDILPATCLH